MKIKHLYAVLASAVLSLSMGITSYAQGSMILVTQQDAADESGYIGSCDCTQCKEIEDFFAGEPDATKREVSVQVWKAAIHPGLFVNADGALYIGTFPNSESLKYTSLTLGLDSSWPKTREVGDKLKVYYKINDVDTVRAHKETIDRLHGIMQGIQVQAASEDIVGKLRIAHDKIRDIFEYTDEMIGNQSYYKLSTCLAEQKACCVGYSTMFKIASNMLGAQTNYVGSDAHMFVGVTIDGVERYVDVSSDDTLGTYQCFMFDNTGMGYPWVIDRR